MSESEGGYSPPDQKEQDATTGEQEAPKKSKGLLSGLAKRGESRFGTGEETGERVRKPQVPRVAPKTLEEYIREGGGKSPYEAVGPDTVIGKAAEVVGSVGDVIDSPASAIVEGAGLARRGIRAVRNWRSNRHGEPPQTGRR